MTGGVQEDAFAEQRTLQCPCVPDSALIGLFHATARSEGNSDGRCIDLSGVVPLAWGCVRAVPSNIAEAVGRPGPIPAAVSVPRPMRLSDR